mmetsp:Transcript_53956/g.66131  ORF Transcript_53956/g.66131 Transcript_53956/m.66131 type:complete len:315 (-) Transcript_53956:91-1035(-)
MTVLNRFSRVGSQIQTQNVITNFGKMTRRKFSNQNVYQTVRDHPNSGLKVLGGVGAVALGGYVAYGLSRPAAFVPASTRDTMANIGGISFATMVRNRVMKTYGYLAGSVALTGVSTYLLLSRGIGMRIMQTQFSNPIIFSIGTLAALWVSISATMSVDYNRSPLLKHGMWATTNGIMGATLLSLTAMAGTAIISQAAMITGCIVGSMSIAAMVSPSDYFLNMGPYLGVGLGLIIAASLGGMFFPHSTLLMNISLYGGLGLFGLYTAYDSQRVLHDAQIRPEFDPISEQMGLYMDTINIFVRVVQILMIQQNRRR